MHITAFMRVCLRLKQKQRLCVAMSDLFIQQRVQEYRNTQFSHMTRTPHLIDSLSSESICHPFAGHGRSHEGHDVLQTPSQLKHDDYQRHRHTSHSTWRETEGDKMLKYSRARQVTQSHFC